MTALRCDLRSDGAAALPFTLYNSESRKKSAFVPLKEGEIGLYVCGMTVYDYCHMGHARVMVGFDVIVRALRAMGWTVRYVRNITDIDDKIIQRANENGETIQALTARFIDAMNEDAARLGCLSPDDEPKATEFIPQMQTMIGQLIEREHAYPAESGDVYFSVESFPRYGRLSGRKLEDMQAGASQRVGEELSKRNPFDFVLWKPAKADEPSWPSPWGNGRPGWHIECSAMSTCCLGHHFDIHGGGGDLLFPHHENEIAQSEGATGETYVNHWMHMGFITVKDEKMSKSLGNFFTIRDVMQQFDPESIRLFILSSHYRSPLDFREQSLKDARQSLGRLYQTLKAAGVSASTLHSDYDQSEASTEWRQRFAAALQDDFNTPEALAVLFELAREVNRALDAGEAQPVAQHRAQLLVQLAGVLGIVQQDPVAFLQGGGDAAGLSDSAIEQAIADRQAAKLAKDYAGADRIRKELLEQGVVLEDSREGTNWRRG